MPNEADLTERIDRNCRIVRIGADILVSPTRARIGNVVHTSIIIRSGYAPIFDICQIFCTIETDRQAGSLVDIDTRVCAGPYGGAAGGFYTSPIA